MSICVCLFVLCVLFILLCSVFLFNFVFLLFPFLHYFVLCICISKFKTFIFRVLLYLYDLRFFPVLFFSYLSTSCILPSSLPTLLSLILPFFHLRNVPFPDRLTYFLVIFCFCFSVFFSYRLKSCNHHRHSTHFTSSTPFLR